MDNVLRLHSKNKKLIDDDGELTPIGKVEALGMMQKCVNMIQEKIDTGKVEGLVVLFFNKEEQPVDYLAGSIKVRDLSFNLQTMLHKIHSDSLTTMEERYD
jgi:hypothetical protein